MTRFIALIVILLVAIPKPSNAQDSLAKPPHYPKAVFGLKGGVNISTFSASVNSETRPKAGLVLGFYFKKQIGPKAYFRPEFCYSNQGEKENYLYPYGGPSIGHATTKLHYINVPVLFELGKKVSFQLGPQIGVLVAAKQKGRIASTDVDESITSVMEKIDFSFVVGAGYSLNDHLNGGVRVNYGVSNIYNPDGDDTMDLPDVQNRVLNFYVAYSF